MARRVKPRAPKRVQVEMTPGQLGMFGSPDPWQPTEGCQCWPVVLRGCQHCKACGTCRECGRCAGPGCACACGDRRPAAAGPDDES